MRGPGLTLVTPWYGHPELEADYAEAVAPELQPGDELLIVDNGDAPLFTPLVSAGRNLGFAGGSNLGLNLATTDAVLFLNNDIALGRRGWLGQIREALEPGVLVGPLRSGRHSGVDGVRHPYIDGWCLAGYREDLLELGGFPSDLEEPAYYSDNILCLNARAAGMRLRDVRVALRHKENVTAGGEQTPSVQRAAAHNRAVYERLARTLVS